MTQIHPLMTHLMFVLLFEKAFSELIWFIDCCSYPFVLHLAVPTTRSSDYPVFLDPEKSSLCMKQNSVSGTRCVNVRTSSKFVFLLTETVMFKTNLPATLIRILASSICLFTDYTLVMSLPDVFTLLSGILISAFGADRSIAFSFVDESTICCSAVLVDGRELPSLSTLPFLLRIVVKFCRCFAFYMNFSSYFSFLLISAFKVI